MTTSKFPSQLAFFQETTQGTGPADAAAWASGATRIRHIADSLDPASIQQEVVEDMRSQTTVFGVNPMVKGVRNSEFSYAVYATGSGVVTADTVQISETPLMTVLEHCMGGLNRGTSTTALGAHTTTTITLAATTGMDEGVFVLVEDAGAPGRCHTRRITDLSGSVITLDQALPFTPADGDAVHAAATAYVNETVLVDSDGAGGPYTFSYLIQKGLSNALENWELVGCKTSLDKVSIALGEAVKMELAVQCASFTDPASAPSPSWTGSPSGSGPISVGPDTEVFLEDYLTTTNTQICVTSIEIESGIKSVKIPTVTEAQSNMEGICGYTIEPGDTKITLNIAPFDSTAWTDFNTDQFKVLRFSKVAAAGSCMSLHFSRCEIVSTPARGATDTTSTHQLVLRAHPDLANAAAGDADLWTSKMCVVIG